MIDLESEGKGVDEGTLDQIHQKKTGALMEVASRLGAVMGAETTIRSRRWAVLVEKSGSPFKSWMTSWTSKETPQPWANRQAKIRRPARQLIRACTGSKRLVSERRSWYGERSTS